LFETQNLLLLFLVIAVYTFLDIVKVNVGNKLLHEV